MQSLAERLIDLTPDQLDEYRRWTDAYESAWGEDGDAEPRPDAFLPAHEPALGLALVQNAKVALEYLARRGSVLDPGEFLDRFPRLAGDDDARVEVLAWGSRLADAAPGSGIESFALPSLAERFPTLRDPIVARRSALYREQGGSFPPEYVPAGYRLLHELPRGGMSRLALIWNERVGREEVLKLMDPVTADDPGAVERFRREIRLAGDRAGARVVPVFQAGSADGHLYYTMPFMRGGSLADRLKQRAAPLAEGVEILADVTRSVHALHTQERAFIHRDLKPANILFSGPALAQPWIADLGLARLLADTADHTTLTQTIGCLGTPGYMAPEQIGSAHTAGPTADIHALGAILYQLLTGRPPFHDDDPRVALRRTEEQEPLRPRGLTSRDVPVELEVIALKALRKDPSERFRTASDFADELDRWTSGRPILSRPPSVWASVRSLVRRHPRTSVGAVASVLALFGLSILSFALFLGERAQKKRADRTSRRVARALRKQAERATRDTSPTKVVLTKDQEATLREMATELAFVVQENSGEGSLELGSTLNDLATIHLALGETEEALGASRQAQQVFSELPASYEARAGLASARMQSGRLLHAVNRQIEGEASTREAVEEFQSLVRERADDEETRFRLARAIVNLGNFARQHRPKEAIAQYQRAIEQWQFLCQPATVQPRYLEWYARTLSNLGLLMVDKGNPVEAIPILTDAMSRAEHLQQLVPKEKDALDCLAACRSNLGEALTAANRPTEALPVLNGALQAYQEQARMFPDETEGAWGTAMVQTDIADALARMNRWAEAVPALESAGAAYEALSRRLPDNPVLKADIAKHRELLARARKEAVARR
jgi:serine/threonine protein kinase